MTRDAIQLLETAAAEMQQSRRPWVFVNPPDDVIHRSTEEVDAAVAQHS